jgi:nucleoside-diphosphate-sugar epimerase
MPSKRILITGVSGLVGGAVYRHLMASPDEYDVHGLSRRREPSNRVDAEGVLKVSEDRFHQSDLSDLKQLADVFGGFDCVVHMAAHPDPDAQWDHILNSNIIGTYNVLEAARLAGVSRVVYASSGQATLGYLAEEPYKTISSARPGDGSDPIPLVTHTSPTRPINIYGCSKVWGEGLARAYADTHGLSCLAIRLGWVVAEDRPPYPEARFTWCSQRDAARLVSCCIDAPDSLKFDIFYAMSSDPNCWMDIQHARDVLGWEPQDKAADCID